MTRAHPRANWIGPPPLTELWLEALLRAFAMLVSNLADIVRMRPSRPLSDWHTEAAPAPLPQQDRDTIEETASAATRSQSPEALMVVRSDPAGTDRSSGSIRATNARSARPSNDEGALTAASHTLAHKGDCHPGSAQRCPGPIPRQSDSQIHGSRPSSAHALPAGMTPLAVARFRSQDSRAPT